MRGRTRTQRVVRLLARVALAGTLLGMVASFGCGGSVGIDNGSIVGRVFGNSFGGSTTPTPLSGVAIVAQRTNGIPAVIRTTVSDANGEFIFANMPTGEYTLGFSLRGFEVIDTAQGATANRTAIGQQVRVFVEPEGTAVSPDVTLRKLPDEGDSTVVVTLVDLITGDPVTNATVTVGAATTSNGGANGIYTLSVPVRASSGGDASGGGSPMALNVIVTADGFDGAQVQPNRVVPIANETVSVTVQIAPIQARITGYVRISQFETLYNRSAINVTVDNVPIQFSGGGAGAQVVDANGFFTINVPASNSVLTRQFNLNFSAPNLQTAVVSNVVAPTSLGTRQLTSPVVMNPITIDLVGTVVDSSGGVPNQLNPAGIPDSVTVLETGQVGNIINGAFTIPDVPATHPVVLPPSYTLFASAFNPFAPNPGGGVGVQESGQLGNVRPVSDGTPNPTFTVPLIVTGGS